MSVPDTVLPMETSRQFSLGKLAQAIGGTLHGDANLSISRLRPLEDAAEGDLSFYAPSNKKQTQSLLEKAQQSRATALLVAQHEKDIPVAQIVVPHPMAAVIGLAVQFFDSTPKPAPGVHPTAVVAASAELGENVRVGPYAVIGERVKIGANCLIHPHVVIYDDVVIGADCVLHAGAIIRERTILGADCLIQNGAVLGSDGFGYIPDPRVGHRRIPHLGSLTLEDRVDVGTNTAIDRATLGESRLGEATKVDNLVQIGHNAKIGKRVLLCGQVGIAGSCDIGDDVIFGGAVGLRDHAKIGKKVRATARTGISGDIPEGTDVSGYPHTTASSWKRESIAIRRLPELLSEFRALKKEVEELRNQRK